MFLRLLHDYYTTLLGEDIYATGKTPKKLVQVVQELHATVDIYFPGRKTRRISFAGRAGFEPTLSKLMPTAITTMLRRNML